MAFNLADMVNNRKKPTETENISDTVYGINDAISRI